jgi:hypothetical protein
MRETGHIINEADIVTLSFYSFSWRWAPDVGVDFITEFGSFIAFVLLWNGLPGCLRIHT